MSANAAASTATTTPPPAAASGATSTPSPAATNTSTPTPPATQTTGSTAAAGGVFAMGLGGFASLLFLLIFSYGAAKLSYDKYQSIGWAILNFFFATFYYPYYAIFLNAPSGSSFGGRRRR